MLSAVGSPVPMSRNWADALLAGQVGAPRRPRERPVRPGLGHDDSAASRPPCRPPRGRRRSCPCRPASSSRCGLNATPSCRASGPRCPAASSATRDPSPVTLPGPLRPWLDAGKPVRYRLSQPTPGEVTPPRSPTSAGSAIRLAAWGSCSASPRRRSSRSAGAPPARPPVPLRRRRRQPDGIG